MIRNATYKIAFAVMLLLLWAVSFSDAGRPGDGRNRTSRLGKVTTNDNYAAMDINNIFNYYSNNGDGSFNKYTASSEGFEFPKGSNDGTVIFEDGLVWGCYKNNVLMVGGSTYNHGLQAGRILQNGSASALPVADNPGDPSYICYRVRPDMKPTTNADSINDELSELSLSEVPYISRFEGYSANDLLTQYWNAWNNWPATQGAPYTDVNNDGVYDPNVDIPGIPGADQTIWHAH